MVLSESKSHIAENYLLIGWQEWCSLPQLHIPAIKAKIDTGARTSALHAFDIQPLIKNKKDYVRFSVHPLQHNDSLTVTCSAQVLDQRLIMSSSGHKELRYVIKTPIVLGNRTWEIEVTLSNREPLLYRMLLGREALQNSIIIEPHRVLCQGFLSLKELKTIYGKPLKPKV